MLWTQQHTNDFYRYSLRNCTCNNNWFMGQSVCVCGSISASSLLVLILFENSVWKSDKWMSPACNQIAWIYLIAAYFPIQIFSWKAERYFDYMLSHQITCQICVLSSSSSSLICGRMSLARRKCDPEMNFRSICQSFDVILAMDEQLIWLFLDRTKRRCNNGTCNKIRSIQVIVIILKWMDVYNQKALEKRVTHKCYLLPSENPKE